MSDPGPNESIPKGLKTAYSAINKKFHDISPQLLQVNVALRKNSIDLEFSRDLSNMNQ